MNTDYQGQSNYQTFIVRLWREENSGRWIAALKNGSSGKQKNFTSLPLLVACLQQQTKAAAIAQKGEIA